MAGIYARGHALGGGVVTKARDPRPPDSFAGERDALGAAALASGGIHEMNPMGSMRRVGIGLIAAALVLAACQPAAPATTAPSSVAIASPQAPASPSAAPSPDVAELLAARLAALTSGEQRLTGTFRAGDLQATFEGSQSVNGPDTSSTLSTTVAGIVTTEQHVKVAGARYVQRGAGPWLVDTAPVSSGDFSSGMKKALDAATDLDAASPDAMTHHLQSKVESFDPVAFGFGSIGQAAIGTATYTFAAKTDGTPVSVQIEAAWKQSASGGTIDATLDLTIEFSKLDNRPVIARPSNVWTVYVSSVDHYSIAHPDDFDHRRDGSTDYFVAPDSKHVAYVLRDKLQAGATLNLVAGNELTAIKKLLGAKTGTNDPVSIAGFTGRLLTVAGASKAYGGKVVSYEAVLVKGKLVFVVGFIAPAGNAAAERVTMDALLATFRAT